MTFLEASVLKLYRQTDDGIESCFYVESSEPLTGEETKRIVWLAAETFEPTQTRLEPFLAHSRVLEIGPRLNVETPFSSNAVAICQSMGLNKVTRIEQSRRYPLSDGMTEEAIVASRLDRMTQTIYREPITTFDVNLAPKPTRIIEVLERGEAALRELNAELGLGMDAWDIAFYADLFRQVGRNPTDVELFQVGNANSEHSRHWFFRGKLVIDGREMPESLFNVVRAPLRAIVDSNSILAFRDNAGVIRGREIAAFISECPGHPSRLVSRNGVWHIACTAETHNHPTLVAPYPGAETGSGGRIRDNTAPGRGALPYAGIAGYCVGNLFLPGHEIPGENIGGEEMVQYASPVRVLIEGSNGISDYGNRFGEPLIGGLMRTFGQMANGERREFRKPVLYTGGISRIQAIHCEKHKPEPGMLIIQIGGPAYRIGVGGGSASSMMQGANTEDLDFNSVQRGNAEMKNRTNRVIRACLEMGENNPIESIHDQGAGGPSNVLTELLEPAGGRIDIRKITLGDRTMSVLEIWSAEYQERYGFLIRENRLAEIQSICERERVNCEVVGTITGDGHITVIDSQDGTTPVHLNLEQILTGIPQKTFKSERLPRKFDPLILPDGLTAEEALHKVFLLPQVGSKGFLVHKVDRSVTGLVAQQQCCGPAQIPVTDASVTADGYFDLSGAATAIGEQPVKMLINPAAGARMAVGEMITNMAAAKISKLGDVRCRANWMWPAKLSGEGPLLYDAAAAMRDIMIALGIAADGGKDSISMAATVNGAVVKSPGELVVLGYAPMSDITKALTPDFKRPGQTKIGYLDLGNGKNRLGGSSLAQAFGQIGDDCPDVDDAGLLKNAFAAIQQLIDEGLILSLHDRSDGGLITTLVEMCLAANCGAAIDADEIADGSDVLAALFNEELGFAFEYFPDKGVSIDHVLSLYGLSFGCIGETQSEEQFTVRASRGNAPLFQKSLGELRSWWEATSDRLELIQSDASTAESARRTHARIATPQYDLSFHPTSDIPGASSDRPHVAILREEGTNGDREMAAAFFTAGLEPRDVTMSDLLAGRATLDDFRGLVFPGGFSFMDVFDSGKGWAGAIRFNDKLREMFDRFYGRSDTFSLGVCNGCQLMALLGRIPWHGLAETAQPRFIRNTSRRFESRWVTVQIAESPSIFFRSMEGSVLGIWVAHGEGRLVFPEPSLLDEVRRGSLAPLAYVDPDGTPTEEYPYNPNGSPQGLTALCTPDGRHLAMMPHPERCFLKWQWPWMPWYWKHELPASPWLRMFQNARTWCLEH
jgi:phosphoribosylformylglycinamidine synthase